MLYKGICLWCMTIAPLSDYAQNNNNSYFHMCWGLWTLIQLIIKLERNLSQHLSQAVHVVLSSIKARAWARWIVGIGKARPGPTWAWVLVMFEHAWAMWTTSSNFYVWKGARQVIVMVSSEVERHEKLSTCILWNNLSNYKEKSSIVHASLSVLTKSVQLTCIIFCGICVCTVTLIYTHLTYASWLRHWSCGITSPASGLPTSISMQFTT